MSIYLFLTTLVVSETIFHFYQTLRKKKRQLLETFISLRNSAVSDHIFAEYAAKCHRNFFFLFQFFGIFTQSTGPSNLLSVIGDKIWRLMLTLL